MEKRSGKGKVRLVPQLSSYHTELQKRVAIVGVSLVIILVLVGIGLYVAPDRFVGKVYITLDAVPTQYSDGYPAHNDNTDLNEDNFLVATYSYYNNDIYPPTEITTAYCRSPEYCVNDDAYCYPVGSIRSEGQSYCSPSFQDRPNIWVYCDTDSEDEILTADQRFICDRDSPAQWTPCTDDNAEDRIGSFYCDGERWNACDETQSGGSEYICEGDEVHQCTDEDENEAVGDFRCNGEIWEQCGDGTKFICQGYDEPQECNDATKYTRENQNNQDGSTHLANSYYCSYNPSVPQSYMWVECTDDTLGEGVDNDLHAERYNDNYVCVTDAARNNARTWLPIPNCQACAGNLEGSCVGSSKIDVRTGNGQIHYYRSTNIDSRIGCAGENQCFSAGLEMDVDEAFVSRSAVCGNHNTFLGCTDGTVAVASDGSHWLCAVHPDDNEGGDGIWLECVEGISGVQFDNFICSYNAGEQEWQWYSEFSCSLNQRYQVRDDAEEPGLDRICDGADWITCADLAIENPFSAPGANVTCNGAAFSVKELICNNNDDDDNDGRVDCDDRTQCSSNISSILNENNLYEVILKKGDCFTTNIMVRVSGFLRNVYSQLHVCDLGTEAFGNRVTLCDETGPILTLDSTTLLRNRFGQPYNDTNNLTFLFTESNPKTVSVMLSRDISETALELPLETFAPNIAAGQRIMLSVDGESYLLWHPAVTADMSFSEANLKLTHIATNTVIPALVYPGTNRYTFDLAGDRLMTFWIDTPLEEPDNQLFKIKALAPGEAPQSFPIPTNLEERFEVTFSKANPVRFINLADASLGTFSVCREDNSADPQQVKVCRNDILEFTLKARNLTKRGVAGTEYAFLFEVVNNTKQVSLFQLTTLSSTISDLTYDPFINAMVAGRRVAVEFENKLYLLRHPMQPFISLPSITVTRYVGDVTTTFPAIGSQDLIDFLIPDGKVSLQRKYGDPPPPFQISALRTEEIAPVDLDLHLSTSMSSLVPVTVNGNIIAAADSVYRLDEQVFNIGIGGIGELLRLRVPAAIGGNALFYYHTVTPSEGALLKQVSIFKLYNLSTATPTQSRSYNAEFVEQFAGGKQFAILLGGQYYLFSYENNNNEVRSFNINRVRLSTLDRVTTFVAIPDGAGVRFDLPDGKRVRVRVDYTAPAKLLLETGLELLTEIPFTGYMTEINPGNEVTIGATTLRLCFLTAYALQPAARVCSTAGTPSIDVLANPSVVVEIGGNNYFLESNGQTGNDKRVFIRKLYSLPAGISVTFDDWFNFIGEVVAHREPYFNLSASRVYLPSASDGRLETFRLKQYPDGAQQAPRNVQVKTPITADGSIVLHDRVVLIEQQETTDEEVPVEATFTTQNYHYLPDNHDIIRFNSTGTAGMSFVVVVDGTEYILGTSQLSPSLVRLSLATGPNILLNRLFAARETRILNLEGTSVEIKVEVIGPEDGTLNAQITVKRR